MDAEAKAYLERLEREDLCELASIVDHLPLKPQDSLLHEPSMRYVPVLRYSTSTPPAPTRFQKWKRRIVGTLGISLFLVALYGLSYGILILVNYLLVGGARG